MTFRPAWADIDLDAIAGNARRLRQLVAPARLCAVVKADAYGHGAVPSARAALAGGAAWLAVALVEEALELRSAGIDAPLLLLSEPPASAYAEVVAHRLRPTVYSAAAIAGLSAAAVDAGVDGAGRQRQPVEVHLKVDTGMHRVGADPDDVVGLAAAVVAASGLHLEGVWTHCAVADQPDHPFTGEQLRRFEACLDALTAAGIHPGIRHAANSAAALAHPSARLDLVRCGIALYGIDPGEALAAGLALEPAMTLVAHVSHVRRVGAGEAVSYGLCRPLPRDATIATVPLGYADGVRRRLSAVGGEVLVGGARRAIAGTVTMDQLMVDCGDDDVAVDDPVVLLGDQGSERIRAEEWAARLDTIGYEVVCGIGARVPRRHRGETPCNGA